MDRRRILLSLLPPVSASGGCVSCTIIGGCRRFFIAAGCNLGFLACFVSVVVVVVVAADVVDSAIGFGASSTLAGAPLLREGTSRWPLSLLLDEVLLLGGFGGGNCAIIG